MTTSTNQVRIYAAGGSALNIVSELENLRTTTEPGFANLAPCYIDTSRSNLSSKRIAEENMYLFEGTDGSGKVRSTNYEAIVKNALAILQKFKPSAFNIILHSGGGGY